MLGDEAAWLLVCTLQLWSDAETQPAEPIAACFTPPPLVNMMAPLYAMLRATAASITTATTPDHAPVQLSKLLDGITAAMQSDGTCAPLQQQQCILWCCAESMSWAQQHSMLFRDNNSMSPLSHLSQCQHAAGISSAQACSTAYRQLCGAGVLALGGLLEGATHGPRALPWSEPLVMHMEQLLGDACSVAASNFQAGASPAAQLRQDAAALAFTQVFQVCQSLAVIGRVLLWHVEAHWPGHSLNRHFVGCSRYLPQIFHSGAAYHDCLQSA